MMSQEMMNLIPMARKDGLLVPARVKTKTGEANQSLLMESLCKRLKPFKATESQQRKIYSILDKGYKTFGSIGQGNQTEGVKDYADFVRANRTVIVNIRAIADQGIDTIEL